MAQRDWLGLKQELPARRRLLLTILSFAAPLLLWSAVSYVPWLWHPLVHITAPGDVDYFVEDMDIPRADFDAELAKVQAANGTLPEGYRVNPVYLPPPHRVARAFYTAFTTEPRLQNEPWLHESLGHSIRTICWAFFISSLLGVPLGILCGTYRFFSRMQEPFIEFFRYLAAPAFGALCVAILGIDDGPKIAIIVIGTFFQQVLVISNTVRKVDPALIEAAQTLGAKGWKLVRRVVIPASITDIYTDMRILLGWAWTYLIVAEVVGTMSGITYFIQPAGPLPGLRQRLCRHLHDRHHRILHGSFPGMVRPSHFPMEAPRGLSVKVGRMDLQTAGKQANARRGHRSRMNAPPDYRQLSPDVAARFERIRQRPVILSVRDLKKPSIITAARALFSMASRSTFTDASSSP
jgi:NitT/TauT family transport system permease protein